MMLFFPLFWLKKRIIVRFKITTENVYILYQKINQRSNIFKISKNVKFNILKLFNPKPCFISHYYFWWKEIIFCLFSYCTAEKYTVSGAVYHHKIKYSNSIFKLKPFFKLFSKHTSNRNLTHEGSNNWNLNL